MKEEEEEEEAEERRDMNETRPGIQVDFAFFSVFTHWSARETIKSERERERIKRKEKQEEAVCCSHVTRKKLTHRLCALKSREEGGGRGVGSLFVLLHRKSSFYTEEEVEEGEGEEEEVD